MNQLDPQQLLPESSYSASSPKTLRDFGWTDTLAALADPSLDPLFWRAERLGAESAWWEHVPFAHWIVCATSPRVLVELGTHTGVSYSAFCHAVARAGIGTRCHAVDTWQGDPQAGLYGPEVVNELRAFHDERFGAFSTLLQCTFDEGLTHVEGGSIDLLHIDGLHTYEAVRHDFESWVPKLSDRAVVLFHDINVRRDDFGVWRLWAELREQYPSFDFVHGHGLGVLAVGEDIPAPVAALCKLTDPAAIAMIRTRFARLGEHWSIDTRERLLARSFTQLVAANEAQDAQYRAELARWSGESEQLRTELRQRSAEAEQLRTELRQPSAEAEQLRTELKQRSAEAEQLRTAAEQLLAEATLHAREVEEAREAAEHALADFRAASARISDTEQELARLRARAEQPEARVSLAETKGNAALARAAELDRLLAESQAEEARLRYELDCVLRSTFWQITRPIRRIASVLPPGLRRQGRRGARVAYWVLTPHRTGERIAYFRARREMLRQPPPVTIRGPRGKESVAAQAFPLVRFFDAEWYVGRYGDVDESGLTPFEHFLIHGTQNLRDPNPAFDTAWYFEAYREVKRECVALEHFVHGGAEEGRRPFRDFDYDCYREQAQITGVSNLEAYHHYLTRGRSAGLPTCHERARVKLSSDLDPDSLSTVTQLSWGDEALPHVRERGRELGVGPVWGLARDAEIHCSKPPVIDGELALFVTYAPSGALKPHVLHYVQSLRREGICVVLIINTERPLRVKTDALLSEVDGLFVRQNRGFDFAAWAHLLQLHPELLNIKVLYLTNDSLIGPTDQAEFSGLIKTIRDSNADVIGLTDNLEYRWHLQSYFLAFKERALRSVAFEKFFKSIVWFGDKHEVIREYELRLANILKAAGLDADAIFRAWDAHNPTTGHWKKLLESGFPFIKAEVISDSGDSANCLALLSARGFDLRLAQWAAPTSSASPGQPDELGDPLPPIDAVTAGRPGEIIARAAGALQQIPWQSRPELTQAALDAAAKMYRSAKLDKIRSIGGELLYELQAAVSGWASGEAGDLGAEELIRAAGIVPLYKPPAAPAIGLPTLIRQRYHEARLTTTRRLSLEPKAASVRSGDIILSILMPVYKTPITYLERTILSVVCQTYQNWELCVVDSGSGDPGITAVLGYYGSLDKRIRVICIPENGGISATTNVALDMATGPYIGLLDHDDIIASDALEAIADEIAKDPTVDLLYTDECKIDENDIVQQLMPKPDWSPLLLTAFMYTGHFSVYRTALVRQLGGLRSRYDFSQDYDLALRVAELDPKVAHIRGYHYGWRMVSGSASVGDKPDARQSNIAALQHAIDRRGWNGTAVALPTSNRVLRPIEQEQVVSIIIPSDDATQIQQSVKSILTHTSYRHFEILVVTSASLAAAQEDLENKTISFVRYDKPFNFSEKCNVGATAARGDFVIFYNDDVRVITPDWIQSLLECLTLPGVGAVSPKLLYRDNTIQHAGMMTGTRRLLGTAFHRYQRASSANMNMAQSVREVSLLSAACLAMRKKIFDELGGFDAINTPREHSDVDLCFRIRELGYSCVYTPHAELTHFGHVSMGAAEAAGKTLDRTKHDAFVIKRYGAFLADDPYFPKPMREILYADSPEEFRLFPRYLPPTSDERKEPIRAAGSMVSVDSRNAAAGITPALDILILSHDLSESGAPRAAYDVACLLRKAGHFVVVASPSDGPYRERLRAVGVDVIIDELLLAQQPHVLDFARNFDKVICNTIVCWPAVVQLHPIVDTYWYVHESALISEFMDDQPGFRSALETGVPVWGDSRRVYKYLNMYSVEPQLIEYGVPDQAETCPKNPGENDKVVIGVFGSYEPRKGQDLAVKAMLSLSVELGEQAELRLFGRNLAADFLRGLERIAEGDDSIVFFPEVDQSECLNQMAACDVILVPSRDDALSFVALDALSLGKALVCSNSTGASEYLEHGISALILSENTSTEIGAALSSLIADAGLRRALADGGRKVYQSNFRPEHFAEKIQVALGLKPATEEFCPPQKVQYPIKSSWSIEGEDVVCKFLMDHLFGGTITNHFFIDVGAHHPYRLSNTYLLYKEGWRGINIEPNPDFISEFERIRPEDLTLNVALADHGGVLSYCRFSDPLLNGFFEEEELETKIRQDNLIFLGKTNVPAIGVREFLTTYVNDKAVDFVNMDVEGFEPHILANWDWQQFRPKLICIEIHGPSIEYVQGHSVHHILRDNGYVFISRIWQSSIFADAQALPLRS
jgi:FkbM family methyltransferase